MPTNPFDDAADDERTDELPVLVETVVLSSAGTTVNDGDSLEDTAERTAKFPAPASGSTAEIESLQTDLAARGAKIAALEEDITRLSARWNEIERHITARDTRIEELDSTLAELRRTLAERHVAEQRLATELARRGADLERLNAENTALRAAAETAEANLAALAAEAAPALTAADTGSAAALRQEVASLSAYIANRHDWWHELKSVVAASAERIGTLQRELRDLTAAHSNARALAARESARAAKLRSELVAATHLRRRSASRARRNARDDDRSPVAPRNDAGRRCATGRA